jgi:hypothetical protein
VGLIPLVAISCWFVIHRVVDGSWLGFLEELYRYTHAQRDAWDKGVWKEALWFPVIVPLLSFGPAVLLAPIGVRASIRPSWVVPVGIYAFLLASYAGKGALGGSRYYGSLVPFFCLAIAHGARALSDRPVRKRALQAASIVSLAATTCIALVRLERSAQANAEMLASANARFPGPFH